MLTRISAGSPKFRLAGHASNWFDFPFMSKRYVINRLEIPSILDDTDKKPWDKLNMCTNTLWKMGGSGPGSSLQALCVVLDVPLSKVDMVGDEVGKEYYKGNLEGISEYCNKDAIATFNVIRRFKYQDIFQFDEVTYLKDEAPEPEIEVSEGREMLVELAQTKVFSKDLQNRIKGQFLGKKVLKAEWDILEDMLCNLYISNKMFKSDSDTLKDSKSAEVKKFVEQLKEEHNA